MKKGSTKNQHYVPQFYQRNFSNDGKTIGTYLIKQGQYVPAAGIKHQARAAYFYSVNMKIEEALGSLEGLASEAIKKIIEDPKAKLKDQDTMALYVFTMLQIGRTPAFVKQLEENANKMGMLMLRKYVEAMRQGDKASEVEILTDEVLDAVSIKMNEPGRLAVGTISQLIDTCYDLLVDAKVLINSTNKALITSDNPTCLYDQHFERIGNLNYALGSSGLQIYLPLTPTLAIMYYDNKCYKMGDRKKHYVELTQASDVEQQNKLVACTADELLFCKDGTENLADMQTLAAAHKRFHIEETTRPFDGVMKTETSKIVGAEHISMYCRLNLSFVKELSKYKALNSKNFNYNRDRFRVSVYLRQARERRIVR